ncbi:2-amino-4-hydroxy-6-hydroxymethyldihydropteridine pyrophosphokinase [Roseobacter sp. SK209-2-6]|uniref:2-amino-4-hydroxy-6- hydroxymethyldihydropteridine diphosphokinase n=1 Tax=Roseobacter sp. SK209-2-6 TaxID=388739 RepID=UPI0000F3CEF7|nr:2-amino-4-hydroxy-6-hydroxymethyldihydropteridine diphosphokinase [Roseobacter sp. SK209-2-6]EBA16087.1 2-amino-4-hydroxy-6-hydroxymethyldihydropteridine pyrophosphokinase [Roseobacter sp. SK209-2-6]
MGSKVTKNCKNVIIALGGNLPLGETPSKDILEAAFLELTLLFGESSQKSRLFQTPCFPAGTGPDYINAVFTCFSELSPEEILQHLHVIEAKFSRSREQRWGMRTLDLDLVAVDDQVEPDLPTYQQWLDLPLQEQKVQAPKQLILPHPRLQERAFVLVPLCDVQPNWMHPVLGKRAAELCAELPKDEIAAVTPLK